MGDAGAQRTSRRAFLRQLGLSAAGIGAFGATSAGLAACGSASELTDSALSDAASIDIEPGPLLLRNVFPDGLSGGPSIVADTGAQRAIFALQRDSRYLVGDDLPDSLDAVLTDADGMDRTVTLPVRAEQIPLHYLSLVFEPSGSGLYTLSAELEGESLSTQFVVAPVEDVPLVHPGQPMPALDSPTTANAQGITPICTRDPACRFHELSIADALDAGKPFIVMVSSPAFCSTGICGPTLEILIAEAASQPDLNFVHVEVYTDPAKLGEVPQQELVAPTLSELGMTFEPSLIAVGEDGIVRARLDASMDRHDIAAALASAVV